MGKHNLMPLLSSADQYSGALEQVDLIRLRANTVIDSDKRSQLGQFFTPSGISLFMASLFSSIKGDVKLLDPGCGPCSLSAAFVDESIKRGELKSIEINAFDIEEALTPFIRESLDICEELLSLSNIDSTSKYHKKDFILDRAKSGIGKNSKKYTHSILNPPYKKIRVDSDHRRALMTAGIEAVNLYSGFLSLTIKQLAQSGELVAIVPRSFCNGPYYEDLRNQILNETSIEHIHLFDSRTNAFSNDKVLQENVIIHLVKGKDQGQVTITSSPNADFFLDSETNSVSAEDLTKRTVNFESVVFPNDQQKFFHIAANTRDQNLVDRLSIFTSTLDDLGIQVSTGPVVDFRAREELRDNLVEQSVPLLYPAHLKYKVTWPIEKKSNAINVSKKTLPTLWKNKGHFIVVRRLSSKEEHRRIVATYYNGSLPGELIGFDNKLNVFHIDKVGMNKHLALGLYCFLNCKLLDDYYRLFGGHTQVNASDLRNFHFPNKELLLKIGRRRNIENRTLEEIDKIIDEEISQMTGESSSPLPAQKKVEGALKVLDMLGMPRAQQNERSALTLLALLNLSPEGSWKQLQNPLIGVTPIMDWCRNVYGKNYAPNSRETFRRFTLHQFVEGGIALYNPDQPDRPVNSPKACYQISPDLIKVLQKYNTEKWEGALESWLSKRGTLTKKYAMERKMEMIPLTLDDGTKIKLSPGAHSQLIRDIVEEFGPRFAPGSEVIYIGDTETKEGFFRKERLMELGVKVNRKGKLPDVVLYWPERDWILLVESVTSHGPVDGIRHGQLSELFKDANPGLVYVTAFPDRKIMAKYVSEVSWETEVWVADAPTHLIHFNGVRFLGPYD
ncbi:BsuBI/PstI family type II restriction endonuclease [Arenicella xantha]|uniref:site-specific DNA-methyltransferase (adenine-specific) n=1 Tax=Arenicella xantha TaxID=644221 RepID=A0A395JSR2_9GAMM|nr:BsuBI/PstI family type II restriction endonuclease [Arenicella xantha]RBP53506.1 adenine-specific DNA-methyltransferase [Arenicella xantha]